VVCVCVCCGVVCVCDLCGVCVCVVSVCVVCVCVCVVCAARRAEHSTAAWDILVLETCWSDSSLF